MALTKPSFRSPQVKEILATIPSNCPDETVLNELQAAALCNFSPDTLRRLGADGPRRVQLSRRRHGFQMGEIRRWLQAQSATSAA
jgi:predicted DNA-binding transcriptional regulator AlpA